MKHVPLLLVAVTFALHADVEPENLVVRIRVVFTKGDSTCYWTTLQYNEEVYKLISSSELVSGTVIYPDVLTWGDSVKVSDDYHYAPDSLRFLAESYLKMSDIKRIVLANSKDTPNVAIWVDPWQEKESADLLLNEKPIHTAKIVLEDENAYFAVHLYVFDENVNAKEMESLVKKHEFQYRQCEAITAAMKNHHIAIIEDGSP